MENGVPAAGAMENGVPAVDVQDLRLSYSKKVPVLQGINLHVKQGHIYGLLGPSGCGKTTLLRCVVGRLKPTGGAVRVLGHSPGSIESGIPGPKVGYMPQELALFVDFTVSETIFYFGRVHGMSSNEIKSRMKFLLDFLDLPSADRVINKLSGGQKRRVSLAVAMLHSPEILILDEPTVGVDPLLRQRIWQHLVKLSTESNTTIIITTHYIEEARAANAVGLMRSGKILAEGNPEKLMVRHNQPSLEDVFLHLCMLDDTSESGANSSTPSESGNDKEPLLNGASNQDDSSMIKAAGDEDDDAALIDIDSEVQNGGIIYDEIESGKSGFVRSCCANIPKGKNLVALIIKNLNQLKRKPTFLMFQVLLPAIQISLYALSIGGTPSNLPVAVANLDKGINIGNTSARISDIFVSQLDSDVIEQHNVTSVDQGLEAVRNGSCWALVKMGPKFSLDFFERAEHISTNDTDNVMHVWLDYTNEQISMTIKAQIIAAYQQMGQVIEQRAKGKVNISDNSAIPIVYENPVYGSTSETFLDFIAPGMICTIIYFLAIGLTALSLVVEKKEGLFERSMISGVTITEILLGHVVTEFLLMAIQITVLLIFAFVVFHVYNVGSIVLIILFELIIGMTGMCMGFMISAATNDEREANQLSVGLVFPFLLISGIIWPLQAMPQWLQAISRCLPLTLAVNGLRMVVGRGWDMTYYEVWSGFSIAAGWAVGFLILSVIFAKFKRA